MLNFLFGLDGSVDRLPYFLTVTVCQVVIAGATGVLLQAAAHPPLDPAWLLGFAAVTLLCTWVSFAMTWKRLHDFELRGAWAFLMFVPVVSVGMFLVFSWLKGDLADPPYRGPLE